MMKQFEKFQRIWPAMASLYTPQTWDDLTPVMRERVVKHGLRSEEITMSQARELIGYFPVMTVKGGE